ncbi:type II toxin-antitoxin system HicA family toxin [Pelistega europaea]|uniref:Type II toxin-antitoxin system HicA family toxin n=1 Tax=Pelistega europaea TaxID=106147 RepID=A0A7Y4P6Q0_9BURK|nr:type II toxin-antitoxin system HicA family toxin [Pelistega europaea]NOL50144.1 type II toxin-antitoxin system HicA family toxin [Pelistega europaea]
MSKLEKLLLKLQQTRTTIEWREIVSLLVMLGYEKKEMSGSRVRFYHHGTKHLILLRRPHPESYLKGGALRAIRDALVAEGYL